MANSLLDADAFHPLKANHNLSPSSLFHMLKPAILVQLEKGIKVVVLTLGSKGLILCSKGGPSHIRSHLKETTQSGSGEKLYETIMQKCPPNRCFGVLDPDKSSHLFAVQILIKANEYPVSVLIEEVLEGGNEASSSVMK